MNPPYYQLDQEIKDLIRQGCTAKGASQQILDQYPELVEKAAEILKLAQKIERELR